jgi:hypothetical protein
VLNCDSPKLLHGAIWFTLALISLDFELGVAIDIIDKSLIMGAGVWQQEFYGVFGSDELGHSRNGYGINAHYV